MSDIIRELGDAYWEFKLETSPTTAHMLGDHRYDDRFEDYSREAEDRVIARLRDFADAAGKIGVDELTADESVSRDVLLFEASTGADALEWRGAEIAVNHRIGIQAQLPVLVSQLPVETAEHADAMVAKFHEIGRALDQLTDRYRDGLAAGRTPPRLHVEETAKALDAWLATPVADDPMLRVQVPADFDDTATAAWKDRLADAVATSIRPAFARMRDFLADELAPHGRPDDKVGLRWLEGGDEAYHRAVARHTSLPLTPDEVHQIGLDTIAALEDEYTAIGAKAIGTIDLDEIMARLRDDPALHFHDPDAIIEASERALAKAKAKMGDWFGRLPKADCLVRPTTSGALAFYYPPADDGSRPGTFFVNISTPEAWGTFEIEAMAYHEGIPGHHLQLAISAELEGVPAFRRHARITAYAEGWGLYTERLADEMGLYSSDLDRVGMLAMDSLRACRLVVDTGMHALGWSRQQAIDYMAANSPLALSQIEPEIDRYIGMPGQALAYMIGRREIVALRRDAEATMRDGFDIKGFHDVVLGSGLMPLPTLRRLVQAWAEGGGR